MTRPVRREGDGGNDSQHVHHDHRAAGGENWRHGEGGDAAHGTRSEEDSLARHPVGVDRNEGRQKRRGQQPNQPDQADRNGAPVCEGDQADGDGE